MKQVINILILIFFCPVIGLSQNLDTAVGVDITLSDGLQIKTYKKWNSIDEDDQEYYYLPVNLRMGATKDNQPEFSFLEYDGGAIESGAIVHFLITWGLTKNQLNETQDSLRTAKGEYARLMGAVMPEAVNPDVGFTIDGKSDLVEILNRSITGIGKTIEMPNAKIAASFQLNKNDAKVFGNALKSNDKELKYIEINLHYTLNFKDNGVNVTTELTLNKNFYELLNQKL